MLRSPTWSLVWSVLRLTMAALVFAAILSQLIRSVTSAVDAGRDVPTIVANFFSFFTILSNAVSVVVLTWAGVSGLRRSRSRTPDPEALAIVLACASTYMIITGVVYNVLLRGIDLEPGSVVVWSNEVLHLIAPLFLLADVLIGALRRRLPWRALWAIIAFPLVWLVYTMVRAPLITNPGTGAGSWYPYPFLDPANFDNGYVGVALYIVGIAAAIVAVGALVIGIGRWRNAP